jgi:DNA-binding transcriptional LysR family regulator
MDRFQAMQVFMGVVDANSFSRAADHLNLPRATVTTTIQALENHLKVRLLNRTTRSVSLTPDGAAYYERCASILAELEETEAAFKDVAQRPQGRLRIDVPSTIGRQILIPRLCDFRQRYPDIELVIGGRPPCRPRAGSGGLRDPWRRAHGFDAGGAPHRQPFIHHLCCAALPGAPWRTQDAGGPAAEPPGGALFFQPHRPGYRLGLHD